MYAEEHTLELPTWYAWAPTGFDARGLGLQTRHDWRVMPVTLTRSSGTLDRVNWETAVDALRSVDPHGAHHEIHHFDHWAVGWLDVLLIDPEAPTEVLREAGEIVCSLAEYPVLDDSAYAQALAEEEE